MNKLNALLWTTLINTLLIGFYVEWVWWLFAVVLFVAIYHIGTQRYQKPVIPATDSKPVTQNAVPRPVK